VAATPPPPEPAPTKVAAAEPTPVPPPSKEKEDEDKPAAKEDPAEAPEPRAKPRKPAPSMIAVTFRTDPEGARVATKNHVYGTTPQPAKLAPGAAYDLTFTKVGYAPATKKYVVPTTAKGPQTLHVSLKKLPEPKKATTTPPPPPPKRGWFAR
jgi:hypothetical protein